MESTATPESRPAIAAISSHVVRGAVGNRCAIPAIERMGFPVWSIPTVILPFHPGHGRGARLETETEGLSALLDDLLQSKWTGEIGGILTGYLANAGQVETVGAFIREMKARNPGLIYLCDPVIGDSSGLYVSQDTAGEIRDRLLGMADIATPNLHEMAWLAGEAVPEEPGRVAEVARRLGVEVVAVTSAPAFMRGNIGNLLVTARKAVLAEHRMIEGPTNGSGDLFSALMLGNLMNGLSPEKAMQKAAASVFEIYARSAASGADELMLARFGDSMLRSSAMVLTRVIGTSAAERTG